MFGKLKFYPYLEDQIISNPNSDLKHAKKIEDAQFGSEALYFYKDTTRYYLPYSSITGIDSMVFKEHHFCCSGTSKMDVPKIHIHCGSENVWIPFTNMESCEKAKNLILQKLESTETT